MTTTQATITNLIAVVDAADTTTELGRQEVANSCKELYHAIENDIVSADKEWMLKGIYNDLFGGNFAEPYMCEMKKGDFFTVVEVYNQRIVPYL